MADLDIRTIADAEFADYHRMIYETFGSDDHEEDRTDDQQVAECDRNWVAVDGGRFVGAAGAFTRAMTVPGGELPIAAVTSVAVAATHRRRGILTRLMRTQLTDLHDRGAEPVAALWASEAAIYGRFGYGLGARSSSVTAQRSRMAFRPDVDAGAGIVCVLDRDDALPHLRKVYETQRARVPGFLDRRDGWWDFCLRDRERHRDGATALRFAVVLEPDGSPAAYAVYRLKSDWGEDGPNGEVQVRDMAATTTQGYAAIWRFLVGIDLHARVSLDHAAVDEVLPHLVLDPRAIRQRVGDCLWVRVVDAARALAARRYAAPFDLVLDLTDEVCPWNTGRLRLQGDSGGGSCVATDAEPDLALSAADLGAIFLGGTTPAVLAAAGRIRERRAGAVTAATVALRSEREPWCPEVF